MASKVLIAILLCFSVGQSFAIQTIDTAPRHLVVQIERLTTLLSDSYAGWDKHVTQIHSFKVRHADSSVIVIFTIAGYNGGFNSAQFLATFDADPDRRSGRPHFSLADVIDIGTPGTRLVDLRGAKIWEVKKYRRVSV